MKRCNKCQEAKELTGFYRNKHCRDGYLNHCKVCQYKLNKDWKLGNKDKVKKSREAWTLKNTDRTKAYYKRYYSQNKEIIREREKLRRSKDGYKIYWADYCRNRRKQDISYVLVGRLRARVRDFIKGKSKSDTTLKLLGCSLDEFRRHLESQFAFGMTWENFMKGEIHIDHIRPCSSFNLSDTEEQRKCFNYKNLQPLWAVDNLRKADKIAL